MCSWPIIIPMACCHACCWLTTACSSCTTCALSTRMLSTSTGSIACWYFPSSLMASISLQVPLSASLFGISPEPGDRLAVLLHLQALGKHHDVLKLLVVGLMTEQPCHVPRLVVGFDNRLARMFAGLHHLFGQGLHVLRHAAKALQISEGAPSRMPAAASPPRPERPSG